MTQWLMETFVWTSVLIAAVLLLRRPVARHFGPQVAYALWALPMLRLLMPPVVLPASFAPAQAEPAGAAVTVIVAAAPVADAGLALSDLLLPLWLGGAVLFLVWRAADYVRMRRELLADARPVGDAGAVRLVETPDVASPVAFGLRDKVVALPVGFMAQYDLAARDMALAHELAHHRGFDLAANLAAQPLLALHWFNPLAWAGWRAMRSDQEAACDARVMAGRARAERAAYAHVIATFAAGPRLSLAASMACPVLGDKSIVHRLRSLTRSDVSPTRRKAGLAAIAGGALVALPLTASVSYAQDEGPVAAEPHREVRTQIQREAAMPAVPQAGQPQIRRRMVLRRDGEERVNEDGADEAEIEQLIDAENACADGASVTRHELDDGRQVVITCRREVPDQAAIGQPASGLQRAIQAIRANPDLSPELRAEILGELETELTNLEGIALSYATPIPPAMPVPALVLVQTRVVYGPGDGKTPQTHTLLLVPAALMQMLAPAQPKVPQSDLPI